MKIICIDTRMPGRQEEKYIHITIGHDSDCCEHHYLDFTY